MTDLRQARDLSTEKHLLPSIHLNLENQHRRLIRSRRMWMAKVHLLLILPSSRNSQSLQSFFYFCVVNALLRVMTWILWKGALNIFDHLLFRLGKL